MQDKSGNTQSGYTYTEPSAVCVLNQPLLGFTVRYVISF